MREMKDSGVEWLEEIPSHWEVMPNKRIMKKKKEVCPQYQGEDILSLTMNGVIVRDLNAGGKMPTTFDGYQRLAPGNLLMCLFDIDVTPRCIGLIKNEGLSSPAYSQFVVNKRGYAPYYYYYYLNLDHTKELLHMAKNLRHSLTEDQLGEIGVAVPPYAEQIRIVETLEEKLPKVDTLIANVQAQIEKLKAYKQSVITETVTKGLDPTVPMKDSGVEHQKSTPIHWNYVRGRFIAPINKSVPMPDANTEITYAPMECVRSDSFTPKSILVKNLSSGLSVFSEGDVLLAKITPCFENGNVAIAQSLINGVGVGSSELIAFTPKGINARFFMYYLQNTYFVESGKATIRGIGGLRRITTQFVENIALYIPSDGEQQAIVAYLDNKCYQIDRLIALKQSKIEKLEQYKKSLIYEYVTGKKEA